MTINASLWEEAIQAALAADAPEGPMKKRVRLDEGPVPVEFDTEKLRRRGAVLEGLWEISENRETWIVHQAKTSPGCYYIKWRFEGTEAECIAVRDGLNLNRLAQQGETDD